MERKKANRPLGGLSGNASWRSKNHLRIKTVQARRGDVYKALIDRGMVSLWLHPDNMRLVVQEFEPRPGGPFRMSLIYLDPKTGPGGKTTADADTFRGHFAQLIPNRRVVQVVEFESEQTGMSGQMHVTYDLEEAKEGTVVTVTCEGIPQAVRLEDNELGSAQSLENLALLMEKGKTL